MIIDCIADLHGHYPDLKGGDLLIVAGDLTREDKAYQYIQFGLWLNKQKYKKKIVIGGNHDNMLQITPSILQGLPQWDYLCDSGTEFEGLKIWGSPWTKTFEGMNPKCKAFTLDTEEELATKWALIPNDTDILITHSPPYEILDLVRIGDKLCSVGSVALDLLVQTFRIIKPKLHVFGHIHEAYGCARIGSTIFANASYVNGTYELVNKPIRIEL